MSTNNERPKGIIDFYLDKRKKGPYLISNNKKGELTCSVTEEWEKKKEWSIACGDNHTYILRKQIGISETNRSELESAISSSLKLNSIYELKTEIKDKIGYEIRIEKSIQDEDSFHFSAGKCERKDYVIYQKKRIYNFEYTDKRSLTQRLLSFSPNKGFHKEIEEWLEGVYSWPFSTDPHPDCKCKLRKSRHDGFVNLFFKKVGLLVPFIINENQVVFPSINYSVDSTKIEDVLYKEVVFKREALPDYLLFMANENSSELKGMFTPYIALGHEKNKGFKSLESVNIYYFLIGSGIGTIVGLLLAKKTGSELKTEIKDYFRKKISGLIRSKNKESLKAESLKVEGEKRVRIKNYE